MEIYLVFNVYRFDGTKHLLHIFGTRDEAQAFADNHDKAIGSTGPGNSGSPYYHIVEPWKVRN